MRVSRISALLITAIVISAISGCITQGNPAPDAVHQIEDDGSAVYGGLRFPRIGYTSFSITLI